MATSSYGSPFDASHSEFSELEMDRYDDFGILSRSLTEISADITEVLTQLDGFVRRVDGDIDEFTKLAHRLQDEITQARMVPIGNLFTRIARTVRDAAKASNKQVELTLAGAETELDNNIIQQIADPLLHLVRNAVAHGIERADERYEAGKPDQGNIAVRAYHKGNHIYVEVEDDGRGVDFERVKATAVESGFLSADEAERLGRRELLDLLFRPGFSTAPRRTELAGRGVGLDVVRSNVTNLNGEIEIETEKGIGSRFTLKVPLTLIISQALFVQCGEQTFAFPLGFVEEIRRIRPSEIEEVGGKLITKVRDVLTEVVRFDEALQLPRLEPVNGYFRLVLVNVGGRQVGVVVEEVLRKDEIVIKNLGEYLRNVKLFPGATIAPDGSLILLVDVNRLIMGESIERRPLTTAMNAARLFLPGATAVARGEIPAAAVDAVGKEKLVVLADDSISVRKFVGRMLEKAGYRVKLACDGLEALEIATTNHCDLVITDLEMPRTNGYELMLHLRQTPCHQQGSGDGGDLARRGQASRARAEGRRGGVHGQAGAGRIVYRPGGGVDWDFGTGDGRAARGSLRERSMTNGEKIRVLVADDSAFMRKVLVSILDSDGAFEVVGEARDGREAVEKSAKLKPHVITMDINMPHMDGLQATEIIMSTEPRPILIVSSESKDGAKATLRALELGAIDFVAKPSSGIDLDMSSVREELVRKLRMASKVRVVRNLSRSAPAPSLRSRSATQLGQSLPACRLAGERGPDCRWRCWRPPPEARRR